MEWWLNDSGTNLLSGVVGDAENPAKLSDSFIVDFLRQYQAARDSFNRLVIGMLPEEKVRLSALAAQATETYVDPQSRSDAIQRMWNRAGVHTCGKYGGTRMGGNR